MSGWAVRASKCIGLLWQCVIVEFTRGPIATSLVLSVSLLSGLGFNFGTSLATKTTLALQFVELFYELYILLPSLQP